MRIEQLDWRSFKTDEARFQGRNATHAETVAAAIARAGWRPEKAGLFHVWPERKRGRAVRWLLDGHSRLHGLRRLAVEVQPAKVLAALHDQLDEEGAKKLSRELNASAVPFTPSEMGRIILAERQQLGDGMPDHEAYKLLAERFPRYTWSELLLTALYAYLPAELCRLLDADQLHVTAARSLGRFARDTGLPAETITKIGLQYIRSGASPDTLKKYLTVAKDHVEQVQQDDMFGENILTRLGDVDALRRERHELYARIRWIQQRREVLEALEAEGGDVSPTAGQRALLELERRLEQKMEHELVELDERVRAIVQFNAA